MEIIIHQNKPVISDFRRDRQTIETDAELVELVFGEDKISIRSAKRVVSVFENETLVTAFKIRSDNDGHA